MKTARLVVWWVPGEMYEGIGGVSKDSQTVGLWLVRQHLTWRLLCCAWVVEWGLK